MVFADRLLLVGVCVCVCFLCAFNAMCMGFLIGFADRPPLVAICGFLLVFLCLWCYVHVFVDWFARQATISCDMCVFVDFLVFVMLCAKVV